MSHRSRVRTPQGVAMFDCYVGGPVGTGMFCFGRSAVSVPPGSHPCTVAILAQGTSWAVAVTQSFLYAVLLVCSVVWSGVVCDLAPWSPAGGAGVCSAVRFFVSLCFCVFVFVPSCLYLSC